MKRQTMLTALLVWAVVVVLAAGVTWTVIDAAGQSLMAGDAGAAAASGVPAVARVGTRRTLSPKKPPKKPGAVKPSPDEPSASATHEPTASPSAVPSSSPSSPSTSAGPPGPASDSSTHTSSVASQERVWQGPPGTVAVRCTGPKATLLSATPSNGYRVEAEHRGPNEIEVKFEGNNRETKVKAGCVGGVPRFKVETDQGSEDE